MPRDIAPGDYLVQYARVAATSAAMPSQFVTFSCADRDFGIGVMAVREIRRWSPVAAVPQQPFGGKDVLDIGDSAVEVYDLATLLGGSSSINASSAAEITAFDGHSACPNEERLVSILDLDALFPGPSSGDITSI